MQVRALRVDIDYLAVIKVAGYIAIERRGDGRQFEAQERGNGQRARQICSQWARAEFEF